MNGTATQTTTAPTSTVKTSGARRFDFARDRFAYANELLWEYHFDEATGKLSTTNTIPKPDYALRCFVITRAAKQFFLHAKFEPAGQDADEATYRRAIRQVLGRSPREACVAAEQVVIPGFADLMTFSRAWEWLLKAECGGVWRSYVLRSHWRMVLPISLGHQERTAARLVQHLQAGILPILHLVTFPQLTMNHGVLLYEVRASKTGWEFTAYDPNDPQQPMCISYDAAARDFSVPRNKYWQGGRLKVIEIYRNWWF